MDTKNGFGLKGCLLKGRKPLFGEKIRVFFGSRPEQKPSISSYDRGCEQSSKFTRVFGKKRSTTVKFYPGLNLRGCQGYFFQVLAKKKIGQRGGRMAETLRRVEFQPKTLKPTL